MIAVAALLCAGALGAAAMASRALRRDSPEPQRLLPWAGWLAALVITIGPGHARADARPRPIAIEVIELETQPAIARTVRARPAELAAAIAPAIFSLVAVAQRHRLGIAGPPFARYVSRGTARAPMMVVEIGLPVAAVAKGELGAGTRVIALPAGPAARLTFRGRHDRLRRAHVALDAWLVKHRRAAAGQRWESYVTNPITTRADDQQTQVFVPLAARP